MSDERIKLVNAGSVRLTWVTVPSGVVAGLEVHTVDNDHFVLTMSGEGMAKLRDGISAFLETNPRHAHDKGLLK
jgi:hypothetical protein